MRPKSMVLILIALGCGLVASIGISQVVERSNKGDATPDVATAPVFVAKVNIPTKELLTAQSVQLEEWPVDRIPPGAVTKLEDIEGRKPKQPLFEGEVILSGRLLDPNHRTFSADRIPPGYRVVPIRVTLDSASMGLLTPGDTVDVIVLLRDLGGTANTILSDISVFAVGDQIERITDDEGVTTTAKTVSLVVTPPDAEKLLLGAHLGEIKLSLRSTDDDSRDVPSGTSAADLQRPDGLDIAGTRQSKNEVLQFLGSMRSAPHPAIPSSEFQMHVMSSKGQITTYTWSDREGLPNELSQTGTSGDSVETPSVFSGFPDESSPPAAADNGVEDVESSVSQSIADDIQSAVDSGLLD